MGEIPLGQNRCKQKKSYFLNGDVAQLVEHQTGMSLTRVKLPGVARDFSPSQLSVQILLQCPHTPCVQSRAFTFVHMLNIP